MIRSMEIWNFESHKHTKLEDLSPGFNLIFGESNSGKCLTGDTVVVDEDGSMRTILDMFEQGRWKVPSLDGERKFSFKDAVCIMANGDKPVFRLSTVKGRHIKATGNHKFFTPNGWVELSSLSKGDWIAISRRLPVFGKNRLPTGHARLIGYMLGDGGMSSSVNFTNEESEVLEDFKSIVSSLSDHHFKESSSGNATTITVSKPLSVKNRNVGRCGLREFCIHHGIMFKTHKDKEIPKYLFTCSEDDIKNVLIGLYVTDGWVYRRKESNSYEIGFSTTSIKMAEQVSHLLCRFGIVSKIRKKKTSWTYKEEKKSSHTYSVDVTGARFIKKFGDVFDFKFAGKKCHLLREAVDSINCDNPVCRYDVVPRTDALISDIQNAVERCGKTECEIRKEMNLHASSSLTGSSKNKSFGIQFISLLAKVTGDEKLAIIANSDIFWDKVGNIESVGIEPTFDLQVNDSHTFFANDIYTHNTSIIRALKLVAYNEFDPKSVRVGEKSCAVEVITDKGRVKVTRGDDHIWEVQKHGEKTQHYEKIGKNILPEAAEVVGLSMVKLGDIEMPVNIMNQLEGHFMLSELNGKNATGSLRAQIIDEISGLSGIEGIIKEVSLDNHRWGREVKQLEDRVEEIAAQKHDPELLDEEEALLTKVKKAIDDKAECDEIIEAIEDLCDKVVTEGERIEEIEDELKTLPDDKEASDCLDVALASLQTAKDAQKLLESWQEASREARDIKDELGEELDVETAEKLLTEAEKHSAKAKAMKELYDDIFENRRKTRTYKRRLGEIDQEQEEAERELKDVLSTIKVCPLTQLPIGKNGCGEGKVSEEVVEEAIVEEAVVEDNVPKPPDEGDGLFDW